MFGYGAKFGYVRDGESGFYLCGFRYYDPSSGRWITRDPIGYVGGQNLYGYVANDPVNNVDAYGLFLDGWKKKVSDWLTPPQYTPCPGDDSPDADIWANAQQHDANGQHGIKRAAQAAEAYGNAAYGEAPGALMTPPLAAGALKSVGGALKPWIKKDLYGKLAKVAGLADKNKFVAALNKGIVGPVGESGVKILNAPVGRYTHELKIGGSANRLLGYIDEHGNLVFDQFLRGGLH